MPIPIGAHDIHNKEDFFDHLTKLIAANLYINTWIFKIDDEFNGRGHASLNMIDIKTISELRKRKVEMTDAIVKKLKEVITKVLPKKVKIAQPSLYRTWDQYIERYCKVGGVIEAMPLCSTNHVSMPSISFFIEPSGESRIVGTFDRIEATQFVNAGCFYPATSLPSVNVLSLTKSIGKIMYDKGIIGHMAIDLVVFPNPMDERGPPLFWAIDLNC